MANAKKAAKKAGKNTPEKKASAKKGLADLNDTVLNTVYLAGGSNSTITLEVVPGEEGQQSDMDITLDNDTLAEHIPGPFPEKPIGTGGNLKGKVLRIRAVITDKSPDTDVTRLTIKLKGGIEDADFPLGKTVSPGGTAEYICKIKFL